MRYIFLLLFLIFSLNAEKIDLYDTKVVVNSNKYVNVQEIINYDFGDLMRHGIYRDIPKNDLKIKNLKVLLNGRNVEFKLINNKKFWRIRIGSPNSYVTSKVRYTLTYNLEGVVVRNKGDKNFIAYDMVGTGWKVPIKKVHGILYLPKVLQGKVEATAYSGEFGSTNEIKLINKGAFLEVFAKNLFPHEGVTIYAQFDKSLLKESEKPSDEYYKKPIFYIFLIPLLAIFYYIAKKFNVFESLGSIAPKYRPIPDLTILEAGLIKDNFVDFKEIKPAILELANLGYIKISKDSDGLYLQKLKDANDSLSASQRMLLDEIFSNDTTISADQLKINNSTFENIRDIVHQSLVDKGYVRKSIKSARDALSFGLFGIGALFIGGFSYFVLKDTGIDSIVPIAVSIIFIAVGVINFVSSIKKGEFGAIFFNLIWIAFSSIFLISVVNSKGFIISLLLMLLIIIIGSYFIYRRANTFTLKGQLAKRHLFGLREFIDRANKDKIKFFLQQDPKYLDRMLPYALLFGLNSHWLHLYKYLDTPLPTWYDGDFDTFVDLDFNPIEYSPSNFDGIGSSPSIDIGDFGSFGGFSGGGIGGGGGGSW